MADLKPSPRCEELVKSFESCARKRADGKFEAYPDPATGNSPWTIGWGSTGIDVKPGTVWTQAQCDARFVSDLARFAAEVRQVLAGVATSQGQFDALVSFAYNAKGWRNSTLIRLHKAGKIERAQLEFERWVFANGKRLKGLVRRRAAEAAVYGSK